jgi:hypothetical protein
VSKAALHFYFGNAFLFFLYIKGQRWLKNKFEKFLLDFASLDELEIKDRVFLVPENLCPPKEDVPKALGRIYDARSGSLHAALAFPKSVGIGTSPWIKLSQMPVDWLQQLEIPPVPWSEKVVSLAEPRRGMTRKLGVSF